MFDKIDVLELKLKAKYEERKELDSQIASLEHEIESLKADFLAKQIKEGSITSKYAICVDTITCFRVYASAIIVENGHLKKVGPPIDDHQLVKGQHMTDFKALILELKDKYQSDTLLIRHDYSNMFVKFYEYFNNVYPFDGGMPLKIRAIRCIVIRPNRKVARNDAGYFISVENEIIRGSYWNKAFDISTKRIDVIYKDYVYLRNKDVNQSVDEFISNIIIDLRDEYGYLPVLVDEYNANNKERHFDTDFTFGNENNRINRLYAKSLEEYIEENQLTEY